MSSYAYAMPLEACLHLQHAASPPAPAVDPFIEDNEQTVRAMSALNEEECTELGKCLGVDRPFFLSVYDAPELVWRLSLESVPLSVQPTRLSELIGVLVNRHHWAVILALLEAYGLSQ